MAASGSCLCGAVRFTYRGEIGPAAICHCADCRKVTGSAFNVSVGVEAGLFSLSGGPLGRFTKPADSGREMTRHFCATCGSPIYTTSAAEPDRCYVKAGLFDDPAVVRPVHQSWTQSQVPWATGLDTLPASVRE